MGGWGVRPLSTASTRPSPCLPRGDSAAPATVPMRPRSPSIGRDGKGPLPRSVENMETQYAIRCQNTGTWLRLAPFDEGSPTPQFTGGHSLKAATLFSSEDEAKDWVVAALQHGTFPSNHARILPVVETGVVVRKAGGGV